MVEQKSDSEPIWAIHHWYNYLLQFDWCSKSPMSISYITMALVLIMALKSSACDLLTACLNARLKTVVARCQIPDPSLVVRFTLIIKLSISTINT